MLTNQYSQQNIFILKSYYLELLLGALSWAVEVKSKRELDQV